MYPATPPLVARLTGPTALILAAFSLLLMPVDYRGGAEEAHPHGVFQLWEEAAHGSLDHHHPAHAHDVHDAGPESEPHLVVSTGTADPDLPQVSDGSGSSLAQPLAFVITAAAIFLDRRGNGPLARRRHRLIGRVVKPSPPPPRRVHTF